jgi:hypothetical protein
MDRLLSRSLSDEFFKMRLLLVEIRFFIQASSIGNGRPSRTPGLEVTHNEAKKASRIG